MHHPATIRRSTLLLLSLALPPAAAQAQFDLQDAHTTASLRGIHTVSNEVAWASGTEGTVLRTTDGGHLWQPCTTPPAAEHLDFRGIQAFDQNTAIVMSSGKGDLSRLYKTTDGCHTWHLLFTNPDKEGFWDAIQFFDMNFGVLMGDPVRGKVYARWTRNGGQSWLPFARDGTLQTKDATVGIFAASNSSILLPENPGLIFAVANVAASAAFLEADFGERCDKGTRPSNGVHCPKDYTWLSPQNIPIPVGGQTDGIFAIAITPGWTDDSSVILAVGGDYAKPEQTGMAAYMQERDWNRSQTPPHGYRSSVAYAPATKTWITTGPNGTDISRDDGRNWTPLRPGPHDPPDADKNWNALSLPFVVGPHGRIGKLRPDALKP